MMELLKKRVPFDGSKVKPRKGKSSLLICFSAEEKRQLVN